MQRQSEHKVEVITESIYGYQCIKYEIQGRKLNSIKIFDEEGLCYHELNLCDGLISTLQVYSSNGVDLKNKRFYDFDKPVIKLKSYCKETRAITYSGETLNGKKHGQGTEYRDNGTTQYIGQFEKGERHGYGKIFDKDNRLWYEGELDFGKSSGNGTQYFPNSNICYQGQWREGQMWGKGKKYDEQGNVRFIGTFTNGKHFEGDYFNTDGLLVYSGSMNNSNRDGFGISYFSNGNIEYKGGWNDGKYCTHGELYNKNGTIIYEGGFSYGSYNGIGDKYDLAGQFMFKARWNGGYIDKLMMTEEQKNLGYDV